MPYAVDLAGLTTIRVRGDFVLKMLLASVLDMTNPVECQPSKMAGVAVPFTCNDERAEAIILIIRQRYRHDELPIYHSRTGNGGWQYSKIGRK